MAGPGILQFSLTFSFNKLQDNSLYCVAEPENIQTSPTPLEIHTFDDFFTIFSLPPLASQEIPNSSEGGVMNEYFQELQINSS